MRYWIYQNGEVPGNYEPWELARLPDFSETSLVCPAEGSIQDRHWQRAGLFQDIQKALEKRPPAPPTDLTEASSAALSPKDILSGTSARLFRHITGLMKELENRREERSLLQSLQKSLAETRQELQAARERISYLEERAGLIPDYEDQKRRLEGALDRTRQELRDRDKDSDELKRSLSQFSMENKKLEGMVSELSRQLADKELTLAKALGTLSRLEEELGIMLPAAPPAPPPPQDLPIPVSPKSEAPEQLMSEVVTLSRPSAPIAEPQPAPPSGATPLPPTWRLWLDKALAFLKKYLPPPRA